MAINFVATNVVRVKSSYAKTTLRNAGTLTARNASSLVQALGEGAATVQSVGNIFSNATGTTLSYINILPIATTNPLYRRGRGTTVFFDNDDQLNDTFELSVAFYCDVTTKTIFNDSGVTLPKDSVVYLTGYDATQQLPTVELASAAAAPTATVFGILESAIADQASGSCVVEGSIEGDTSSAGINDPVYLSDTPGAYAFSPGTISVEFGRVQVDAVTGSFVFKGAIGGSGGGPQGVTGLMGLAGSQGATGIAGSQGDTGVQGSQGVTGVEGDTGLQGFTGTQGSTGIQGNQGSQGVTGAIGDTGIQGTQGDTGIQGNVGATGIQGIQGDTGFQGDTGIAGDTGLAFQGDTGIAGSTGTGTQGDTGIGAGGTNPTQVLATVVDVDPIALGGASVPLYSVPGGTSTVITNLVLRLATANGVTTTVTAAAGWDPSTTNVFSPQQTTGVTAANDIWVFDSSAKSILGVAGATLLIGVTGMAGNTGIFDVDVLGYEF